MTKNVKTLDTILHGSLQSMICQQVTLSGDAEWPKVADAVIEACSPGADRGVAPGRSGESAAGQTPSPLTLQRHFFSPLSLGAYDVCDMPGDCAVGSKPRRR